MIGYRKQTKHPRHAAHTAHKRTKTSTCFHALKMKNVRMYAECACAKFRPQKRRSRPQKRRSRHGRQLAYSPILSNEQKKRVIEVHINNTTGRIHVVEKCARAGNGRRDMSMSTSSARKENKDIKNFNRQKADLVLVSFFLLRYLSSKNSSRSSNISLPLSLPRSLSISISLFLSFFLRDHALKVG